MQIVQLLHEDLDFFYYRLTHIPIVQKQRKNSKVLKTQNMKISEEKPIYIIDCVLNVFKKLKKLTDGA